MPNRNYNRGRVYEYKEKKKWEKLGHYVIRSSGSHGIFDLLAIGLVTGKVKGIQVKCGSTRPTDKADENLRKIRDPLFLPSVEKIVVWYKRVKGKKKVERQIIWTS